MADGYFERGEIYQIRSADSFGSEQGAFRPGVIVSNDAGNRVCPTVIIAYMTTKDHNDRLNVETYSSGRRSFILCNQIATIDKRRLCNRMGALTQAEMREVEDAMGEIFDLGYTDTAAIAEKDREIEARDALIAEKNAEIEALKRQLNAAKYDRENLETSYKVENAMWQGLYGKALDQLIEMKLTGDIQRRIEKPKVEEPVIEEPDDEGQPVVDDRVDINNCTITALKNLGFRVGLAKTIKERGPYTSVADLKKVPGMKATQFRIMEPKLKCVPIVEEPKQELVSAQPEPDPGYEVEGVAPVKVNINTASALEICNALGLSMTVCYSITGCRKRNGLYKSVSDLLDVPKFTAKHMEQFGPMMEV